MNALAIIGCAVGGAGAGGLIGVLLGDREGGDFNFAPLLYGAAGVIAGGFIGLVIGAVAYAE